MHINVNGHFRKPIIVVYFVGEELPELTKGLSFSGLPLHLADRDPMSCNLKVFYDIPFKTEPKKKKLLRYRVL